MVQVKHLTSLNTFLVKYSFIILINTFLTPILHLKTECKKRFQYLLLFCCFNVDFLFGSTINIPWLV